jgi:molecular chaperone GrpE
MSENSNKEVETFEDEIQNEPLEENADAKDNNIEVSYSEEQIDENEEIENEKFKKLESDLKSEKDKYLRLFAEYDNYRKRTSKEKMESYGDATAKTISEILPIIDNFERAIEVPCSDENYQKGIEMIFSQLMDIIKKIGVQEIESLNKPFDPNLHNAIKQVENEELESNIVCDVFQKGYKLGDRVIRHAMVSVNN